MGLRVSTEIIWIEKVDSVKNGEITALFCFIIHFLFNWPSIQSWIIFDSHLCRNGTHQFWLKWNGAICKTAWECSGTLWNSKWNSVRGEHKIGLWDENLSSEYCGGLLLFFRGSVLKSFQVSIFIKTQSWNYSIVLQQKWARSFYRCFFHQDVNFP